MALSPFEIVDNIFVKEHYLTLEEREGYSKWMVNKILSNDPTLLFLAQELNKPIDDTLHYDCLWYGLPKSTYKDKSGKVKGKYIQYLSKKPKEETEVNYLSEFFRVDVATAKMYHQLIDESEMKSIVEFFENRGVLKKK